MKSLTETINLKNEATNLDDTTMKSSKPFMLQGSDLHPKLFKGLISFIQNNQLPSSFRKIYHVPVHDLISEAEYMSIDHTILTSFSRGPLMTVLGIPFSDYYKIQRRKRKKSIIKTLKYIRKYYIVYRSLSKNDFRQLSDQLKVRAFPWLFVSDKLKLRLDGHHRSAIYKFLGKSTIPTMVITPSLLRQRPLTETLKNALNGHSDPQNLGYNSYS